MTNRCAAILATLTVGLTAVSPAAQQDPPTGPVATRAERIAVQRNAGLFELSPGVLHGGGAQYDVRFRAAGMRLEPALGTAVAVTQHLSLTPISVGRGGEPGIALPSSALPEQHGRTAVFAHAAGVRERFAVGVDGVELSWVFDARPPGVGDLVVRYELATEMPGPRSLADGGIGFGLEGIGGVTIGSVTGIDALGRRIAGGLRYADGELELSLPAAFVDNAAYPLVLDPVIGPEFGIWNGTLYSENDPDCSYERTQDRFLVTFQRAFSSTDIRLRAQLVDRVGGLFQGVHWITTGGVCFRPRVASFSREERFGVAWASRVGSQSYVHFRSVSVHGGPASTAMSPTSTLASGPQWTLLDVDIGSEGGQFQQDYAFVVVWDDTDDDRIYARRVGIDSAGNTVLWSPFSVFNDSTFNGYSQPAIARSAESGGKLMVVARRFSGVGPQRGVSCALVSARNNTVTNRTTIVMNSTDEFWHPDVDGYGDEWVIAWRQNTLGTTLYAVAVRSAQFDGTNLSFGATQTLGGSSLVRLDHPSVGYSHGKTWLGYRENFLGSTALRARGIDPKSCIYCQDLFTAQVPAGDTRVVVATTMSGNETSRQEGLVVWEENFDIWAQRIADYGNQGTVVNLGGGCGAGGTQSVTAPNLGMSSINCSVYGLAPTAVLTMFNFTLTPTVVTCGTCEWLQPQVALILPITASGSARFTYGFPCDPTLAGVQFETQWTTYDPATAPCAIYPGFAVTDRQLHTIGQ
ncbi:MAG: hypothetical protein NXI31_01755 [bacterium]|nr:hypothetical protein [bacterium]